MFLRHAPWHWPGTRQQSGDVAAIDAGLRDYTRSFAVPLVVVLGLITAVLGLACLLTQFD